MQVSDLVKQLSQAKKAFNRKHQNLKGKYSWANDVYAKAQIADEKITINSKTTVELLNLKDLIPKMRDDLQRKKAKRQLPEASDREAQVQSALVFLQSNPTPEKIAKEINQAIGTDRRIFASYILKHLEDNPINPISYPNSEQDFDIIQKERAYLNEKLGVNEIIEDIEQLNFVEQAVKNFEQIIEKDFTYFLVPEMLSSDEEIEAKEWMKSEPRLNLLDRVSLNDAIFKAKKIKDNE